MPYPLELTWLYRVVGYYRSGVRCCLLLLETALFLLYSLHPNWVRTTPIVRSSPSLVTSHFIYCPSVFEIRGLAWTLPKISDVVHILLVNGCNTYATQNFSYVTCVPSGRMWLVSKKKSGFGARVRYSLFTNQYPVSWFGDMCLVRFLLPFDRGESNFAEICYSAKFLSKI